MGATNLFKYKLTALFIILALSFLVNPAFASQLSESQDQLNNVNSQLDQTRQKITQDKAQESQLISQIQQMDSNIASVQKEYDRLNDELKMVSSQRADTEKQLSDLQAQLYRTQQDLDSTNAKLTEQRGILNKRIQNIYENGGTSYLNIILNSSNFTDLLTRIRFLEFIVSQDIDIVEQISKTKAAIEGKKLKVEQERAAVNSKRIKLVDEEQQAKQLTDAKLVQKTALQAQLGEKQSLLSQIQSNRAANELLENQLLAESNSIAAKIRQLDNPVGGNVSPLPASYSSASGFIWPTNGPITSPFGLRMHPVFHRMIEHTGVDIGAPYGQAIVAAQDGVVFIASVGWNGGYGNMTVIRHGGGISTLYAHQSRIIVSDGQHVSKGQTIGYVGATGDATGPHLHFEVRVDGNPVDPMKYLP